MRHRIAIALALAGATLLGSACGNVNLWPLRGGAEQDLTRPPAGATAYQCEGGKRLFVRYLDNGAAAWVILPERQFRLNQAQAGSGRSYGNGEARLEVNGDAAVLFDGSTATYAGCKSAG